MSISDYTGKKQNTGITGYTVPSNEMTLSRPLLAKISKSKNVGFVEGIMKKKRCTVHYYGKLENFDSDLPKNHNKFLKTERRTLAGDIQHQAKKKETSSPSVHDYNPEVWKKRADVIKPLGNYKNTADKITFAEEAAFIFGSNPEPSKYNAMDLDKMKQKPRYTKIHENGVRFKKVEKNDKPSPLSYNVSEAISKS